MPEIKYEESRPFPFKVEYEKSTIVYIVGSIRSEKVRIKARLTVGTGFIDLIVEDTSYSCAMMELGKQIAHIFGNS